MTPTTSHDRTFPPTRPIIRGLDYFGDRRTAQSVSRDYIDYFATGQGNLGLAVGDVSGKEVSAALLTSSMRSMTRALRAMRSLSLKTLMRTVDKLFSRISPDKCYATLFLGEYDPTSGRLRYVNAGHEPPFVLRKRGEHFHTVFLEPGGPLLGMIRESSYRESVVSLQPGDVLVAYTDGLCETTNPAGEEWGWPRFLKTVEDAADQRARDIVADVMLSSQAFAGGAPPRDDVTLFVGRVEESAADSPHEAAEHALVAA